MKNFCRSLIFLTILCGPAFLHAEEQPPSPDFKTHIQPLLAAKCIRCHGLKKRDGKLDMRTVQSLLEGGVTGPAIVPGDAKASLLIELIHYHEMPPKKEEPRVSKDELEMLRRWINQMQPQGSQDNGLR